MATSSLFDATVSSLYETVLDTSAWPQAMANVAALFSASNAFMFDYDYALQTPSNIVQIGYDPAVEQRYITYFHRLDPGRDVGERAAVGEWLADETLLDVNAPPQQEYVRDFALPSGIGRNAGFKIAGDSHQCTYLSLQRRPGTPRFGSDGRQVFAAIFPHLHRVAHLQARVEALSHGVRIAHACLDQLHAGILVLDAARHIRLVNRHSLQMMERCSNLRVTGQQLRGDPPSLDEALGRAVAAACAPRPRGAALRIPRAGQAADLLLSVLPIPPSHDLAGAAPEPLAIVIIGQPGADSLAPEVYRELFALTNAEAALLSALASGLSPSEWARRRGISVSTVRTQLAALFEKTGVDSQAKLVALAKTLPAHG